MDDGSPDNCPAMCDAWKEKDSRIVVLHKENGGLSDARNSGMGAAHGEFISFIDGDDWIEPRFFEILQHELEAQNADVAAVQYRLCWEGDACERQSAYEHVTVYDRQTAMRLLIQNQIKQVVWNKLYRRDLILEHNLQCDPSISWCEDFIFNLQYLQHVQQVYVMQQPVYYYVKRKDSLVVTELRSTNVYEMKREVFTYYRSFFESIGLYEAHRGKINGFMLAVTTDSLFRLPAGIIGKNKKEVRAEYLRKRELFKKEKERLDTALFLCYNINMKILKY